MFRDIYLTIKFSFLRNSVYFFFRNYYHMNDSLRPSLLNNITLNELLQP